MPVITGVRVGIRFGGRAMRGPARVRHADLGRRERMPVIVDAVFQHTDPPHRTADMHLPRFIDHRNARRVIPAIFQTLKPFNEQRLTNLSTDISDNSAHAKTPFFVSPPWIRGRQRVDVVYIGPVRPGLKRVGLAIYQIIGRD